MSAIAESTFGAESNPNGRVWLMYIKLYSRFLTGGNLKGEPGAFCRPLWCLLLSRKPFFLLQGLVRRGDPLRHTRVSEDKDSEMPCQGMKGQLFLARSVLFSFGMIPNGLTWMSRDRKFYGSLIILPRVTFLYKY